MQALQQNAIGPSSERSVEKYACIFFHTSEERCPYLGEIGTSLIYMDNLGEIGTICILNVYRLGLIQIVTSNYVLQYTKMNCFIKRENAKHFPAFCCCIIFYTHHAGCANLRMCGILSLYDLL